MERIRDIFVSLHKIIHALQINPEKPAMIRQDSTRAPLPAAACRLNRARQLGKALRFE